MNCCLAYSLPHPVPVQSRNLTCTRRDFYYVKYSAA